MAYYVMLSTLTDEGRRTIKEKPERIKEVNTELDERPYPYVEWTAEQKQDLQELYDIAA